MQTKFNSIKCKTCIYRGRITGGVQSLKKNCKSESVYCNYGFITDSTCLKYSKESEFMDIRGDDYDNCNLYQKGAAIINKPESIVPRRV